MPNRFSLSMTTLFLIGFLLSTHSTFAQQQIKEVIVPARAPWVHSGIYVHAGDEISLQAIGYWAWGEAPQTIVTPDGFAESEQLANGCQYFSLVGSIGLNFENRDLICLGSQVGFVAPSDGSLYFAMHDMGRDDNWGEVRVYVAHNSQPIKPQRHIQVTAESLAALSVDRIEIESKYVSLQLPKAYVADRIQDVKAGMDYYDHVIEEYIRFTGDRPNADYKIRFYEDTLSAQKYGFGMAAGNPIFYHKGYLDPEYRESDMTFDFLRIHDDRYSFWAIIHELGHVFTVQNNGAFFMVGAGLVEAWANVLAQNFLEKNNRAERNRRYEVCRDLDFNLSQDELYKSLKDYNWRGFCMLMEVRDITGFEPFSAFLQSFNQLSKTDMSQLMIQIQDEEFRWTWLIDQFLTLSGKPQIIEVFEKYGVPYSTKAKP